LWHEAESTNDVLSYLEAQGDVDAQAAAYRILYPAYGTYAGDAAGHVAPAYGGFIYLGGVVTGHILGRRKARQLYELAKAAPESDALPPALESEGSFSAEPVQQHVMGDELQPIPIGPSNFGPLVPLENQFDMESPFR
jgi:hypothetical protein